MTLKEMAKARTTFSQLMEGRTKLETKEVRNQPISLIAYDPVTMGDQHFAVCVFKEHPDNFVFAGSVLTDLLDVLALDIGSVEALNEELKQDPLVIRLISAKAKSGREYTKVEVV